MILKKHLYLKQNVMLLLFICKKHVYLLCSCLIFSVLTCYQAAADDYLPWSETSLEAYGRAYDRLHKMLKIRKLQFGAPVFIRIFKLENELELWLKDETQYKLFKTYIICYNSGTIGPKTEEGDHQSPEGFYQVNASQMNPWSKYHLAFNLGYPNEYDQHFNRSGSALMIHGRCSSIGCFAMTDYYMDEIYTLADAALSGGQQSFQVHIFPFKFSHQRLKEYKSSVWLPFWLNLKEGYEIFENSRIPPQVGVEEGRYVFDSLPSGNRVAQGLSIPYQ